MDMINSLMSFGHPSSEFGEEPIDDKGKYVMRRWVGIHYGILAVNATVFVVWFVVLMSGIFKTI